MTDHRKLEKTPLCDGKSSVWLDFWKDWADLNLNTLAKVLRNTKIIGVYVNINLIDIDIIDRRYCDKSYQ
jgi:hypothetical protein